MFVMPIAILAVIVPGLGLAAAAAIDPASGGKGVQPATTSSEVMQHLVVPSGLIESTDKNIKQRQDAVHRCYRPTDEFGPAPSVEDCNDVIKQLQEVEDDITVQLVEGCYKVWSGNCTGAVCPQRVGSSTISPSVAAQYMVDSVMTECIAHGLRGWYLDRDCGIGVYLA
ncbi:hypothetical protein F5Y06DRAFT_253739 [Hypoxylon sp. FL0890]|nr:hypothetical protein F5Y06DRAFT_253739 [Hypoxylon sp. FL0890]